MNQSPKVKDLQAVMDAKSQVMEAQAWIGEIEARILGEEEDVSMVMEVDQAERLLDRHWELKIEVEECSEASREILDELAEVGLGVERQVEARMMESSMENLNQLWEERRELYEQCWDLQRFLHEADEQDELIVKLENLVQSSISLDDSGITDDASFDSGLDTSTSPDLAAVQENLLEWATG